MRPEYEIKDPELKKLVEAIYREVDQPFWDATAFEVAKMIQKFIDSQRKKLILAR